MRNLLYYSNCQGEGLDKFMRLNPAYLREFKVTIVLSFMTDLGLTDPSILHDALSKADVFIYHWLSPEPTAHKVSVRSIMDQLPAHCQTIPLSVVFNHGPFIFHYGWTEDQKVLLREKIKELGITAAAKFFMEQGDLGWAERWDDCMVKMKCKEITEGVPEPTRISGYLERHYRTRRLLMTHNHPTSALFWPWAILLADYLGIPFQESEDERAFNPNYAGLPCSFCICEAARAALGLEYPADAPGETFNETYTALSTLL
jgi:hypothetical protein